MRKFFIAILIILWAGSALAYTETFYICHGGDGSAPETAICATAWDEADFNTAANWNGEGADANDGEIGPNDIVYFMDEGGPFRPAADGGANSALLTIPESGTAGKPITLAPYTGDSPVLLGSLSKSTTGDWTEESANVWKTADSSFQNDPGVVVFGTGDLAANIGVREAAKLGLTASKEWWYDAAADCVYTYSTANPATAFGTVEIGAVERILTATGKDYITVGALTFKYAVRNALWIIDATNWIVNGATVKIGGGSDRGGGSYDGNAIAFYEEANTITVQNSTVEQWFDIGICIEAGYELNNVDAITIDNNTVSYCDAGITAQSVGTEANTISNITITNNDLSYIGLGWSAAISGEHGYGIEVADNAATTVATVTITDNHINYFAGSGINLYGVGTLTCRRNLIENGDRSDTNEDYIAAIMVRKNTASTTGTIDYNIIRNNNVIGYSDYDNDGALSILNNTIINCADTYKAATFATAVRLKKPVNLTFKNNLVEAKVDNYAVYVITELATSDFNYNLYWAASGDIAYTWFDSTGYDVTELAGYKTEIADEANSQFADPKYMSSTNSALQYTSTAVDGGVDVSLTTDYYSEGIFNTTPDIGAIEYSYHTISTPTGVTIQLDAASDFEDFTTGLLVTGDNNKVYLYGTGAYANADGVAIELDDTADATTVLLRTWADYGYVLNNGTNTKFINRGGAAGL